ncbi:MAG: hypothetical protein WC479_05335 [Candidatus Izemoplasmatales bacterium]|jgi:hypothetical protein|nr:hypothetical protein [Candidatus Izemoplasmatales bacterium]
MGQKAKLAEQILHASRVAKIAKASRLGIAISAIMSFMIFAISYYGEEVGNFTFTVNEMAFKAGIQLYETLSDTDGNTRLNAPQIDSADGMTSLCGTIYSSKPIGNEVCLPSDEILSSVDGSNSGDSYLVYTFYIRNGGTIPVDLSTTIDVISATRGAEEAVRLRVIFDGVGDDYSATTYARVQTTRNDNPNAGLPEPETTPFFSETQVLNHEFINEARNGYLQPGETIRITVILWYEGEDADHNLNIVGGGVKLSMEFTVPNPNKYAPY